MESPFGGDEGPRAEALDVLTKGYGLDEASDGLKSMAVNG
jgi:hypothetical protein